MNIRSSRPIAATLIVGSLAGLAGGVAEIGWITLYAAVSGIPVLPVARGIVESVIPGWAPASYAVALGILIHLGLAVALGNVLVFAMRLLGRRLHTAPAELVWVTGALAAVWAINFFVILPRLNPGFVILLPYGATMLSKLLFGVAAATVLRARRDFWAEPAAA